MKWDTILPGALIVLAVGGIIAYQRSQPADKGGMIGDMYQPPSADRVLYCRSLQGEPENRLDACLAELPLTEVSPTAIEKIKLREKNGKIGIAGSRINGIDGILLRDMSDEIRAGLMGADEEMAARLLRESGMRGFVVHRDLVGALDRDSTVLARLAHHDHLEWFQLHYVTDRALIYSVRTSRTYLPQSTGEDLVNGLRARLSGQKPVPMKWKPPTLRLIGNLRLQGHSLAMRHVVRSGKGATADEALDDLARRLTIEWEKKAEIEGHGMLSERLDDIRIEVHVVMEKAPVEPRSRFAIFDLWEMGIDGAMFAQRDTKPGEKKLDEKFSYMPGSELTARSMKSADQFLRFMVDQHGWVDRRPWEEDHRTKLDIIRTQHFAEVDGGGGRVQRLVRGMPEVEMEDLTDKYIQDMLVAGGEWWLYNLKPDNSFEYKYWPTQNRRSDSYNEVRHILAARDLADTWRYRQDPRYLEGSMRSMEWLRQYEILDTDPKTGPLPHPPEGTMLFRYPSYAQQAKVRKAANQKLGTVAVALLGWVEWAKATKSKAEDERIRKMAKFVMANQEADGRFRPYFVNKGHPYEFERNDIVPGEAALSLGMVAEYFDEKEWIKDYPKFIEYYRPWFRERKVKTRPTGRWPHDTYENQDRLDLVQFGPWSVMAAKQYYSMTGNEEAAAFGLEVADWMIDYYQWRGDRTPFPDYVGGYYKLPTELPAMQTFCYSEGTAAAYEIAALYKPEVREKYGLSTKEAIRFLAVMQFDETDSYFTPRPEMVRGGIKYTMNENKIRIDYVGHGLSTLSQYLDARDADPAETLDVFDPTNMNRPAGYRGSVPGKDYGRYRGPGIAPAAPAAVEPVPE